MHFETYVAPDYGNHSNDLIRMFSVLLNRHVIRQLGYTFLGKEPRHQNICIRQVKLACAHVRELGLNLKAAALAVIEQRRKDGGGIEIWVAEKIDRAVHACQRNRPHVTDNAVILDRLKTHISETLYDRSACPTRSSSAIQACEIVKRIACFCRLSARHQFGTVAHPLQRACRL